MSDTPRVDAQMESPNEATVPIDFARTLERELAQAKRENCTLRTLVAKSDTPCPYCGLLEMAKCVHGFPGCARADDIICGEEQWLSEMLEKLRIAESQLVEARKDVERLDWLGKAAAVEIGFNVYLSHGVKRRDIRSAIDDARKESAT